MNNDANHSYNKTAMSIVTLPKPIHHRIIFVLSEWLSTISRQTGNAWQVDQGEPSFVQLNNKKPRPQACMKMDRSKWRQVWREL